MLLPGGICEPLRYESGCVCLIQKNTMPTVMRERYFVWLGFRKLPSCYLRFLPVAARKGVVPGLWGWGFVAVLYAVVEVQVGGGSQAFVVKAGQA